MDVVRKGEISIDRKRERGRENKREREEWEVCGGSWGQRVERVRDLQAGKIKQAEECWKSGTIRKNKMSKEMVGG